MFPVLHENWRERRNTNCVTTPCLNDLVHWEKIKTGAVWKKNISIQNIWHLAEGGSNNNLLPVRPDFPTPTPTENIIFLPYNLQVLCCIHSIPSILLSRWGCMCIAICNSLANFCRPHGKRKEEFEMRSKWIFSGFFLFFQPQHWDHSLAGPSTCKQTETRPCRMQRRWWASFLISLANILPGHLTADSSTREKNYGKISWRFSLPSPPLFGSARQVKCSSFPDKHLFRMFCFMCQRNITNVPLCSLKCTFSCFQDKN